MDHVKDYYASTRERIRSLVEENGEITFDLLWALFKPNDVVYGTCFGTEKPRCIVFDFEEVRKLDDGTEYFHIEGRYLDFDGKDFGEASTALGIVKLRGTKRIDSLEAFPLQYHPNEKGVRRELIDCGRKFLAFGESHHQQYEGVAFFKTRRELIKVSINGRIMVDASLFFKTNPNYTKPRFDENRRSNSLDIWMDLAGETRQDQETLSGSCGGGGER